MVITDIFAMQELNKFVHDGQIWKDITGELAVAQQMPLIYRYIYTVKKQPTI